METVVKHIVCRTLSDLQAPHRWLLLSMWYVFAKLRQRLHAMSGLEAGNFEISLCLEAPCALINVLEYSDV